MRTDECGYVIRCVDLEGSGTVTYRGMNDALGKSKDAIPNRKTYTLTGARRAATSLRNKYSGMEYCIERQDDYYWQNKGAKKSVAVESIDKALQRLDELWDAHDFHNGDKMRINEVRAVLNKLKEEMT